MLDPHTLNTKIPQNDINQEIFRINDAALIRDDP